MSFGGLFDKVMGTAGMSQKQRVMAGLQAGLPLMMGARGQGGMGNTLGQLLQGVGQARQWAGANRGLPQAPNVPNVAPGSIPAPLAVPNIAPQAPGGSVGQFPMGPAMVPGGMMPPAQTVAQLQGMHPWLYQNQYQNLGFGGMGR